jgi:uncharacterized protein YkwD
MKTDFSKGLAAGCGCLLLAGSAQAQVQAQSLDGEVLRELNFARARPAEYAEVLLEEARSPRSATTSFAYEDRNALAEAVDFLRRQAPLQPLRVNAGLTAVALDHATAQGREGGFGHVGSDGASLGDRLRRRGVWASLAAEDISYGYRTPQDVVRQLIVDSGVPGRGHRANIFGSAYQAVGVGCGGHPVYGAMCVIDFAGALTRR